MSRSGKGMLNVANTDVIFRHSEILWSKRKPPEQYLKKGY